MKVSTLVLMLAVSGGAIAVAACSEETAPPPPPDTSNVCSRDACAVNNRLRDQCTSFLSNCLTYSISDDECVGGALAICSGI